MEKFKLNHVDVKTEVDTTLSDLDLKTKDPIGMIAAIFSWIATPLMIPVYGIILIFALSLMKFTMMESKVFVTTIVFALNAVLPVLLFCLLKFFGVIKDVALNEQKERAIPYIIMIICYLATAYFLYTRNAPMWVVMFFVGGSLAGLVNMIVNGWWKISAHGAAAAGLVAMLVRMDKVGMPQTDLLPWIVATIIFAGLLCSSRVYLRRHTLGQVLAGSAVGYIGVYVSMLFAPEILV